MRALLLVAALLVVVSGCASVVPATCEEPDFDPPAQLGCDAAIGAARTAFAGVSGIVGLRVEYFNICPPNARCVAPDGSSAAVVATLGDRSELFVRVYLDEGGMVQADPPQPYQVDLPFPEG